MRLHRCLRVLVFFGDYHFRLAPLQTALPFVGNPGPKSPLCRWSWTVCIGVFHSWKLLLQSSTYQRDRRPSCHDGLKATEPNHHSRWDHRPQPPDYFLVVAFRGQFCQTGNPIAGTVSTTMTTVTGSTRCGPPRTRLAADRRFTSIYHRLSGQILTCHGRRCRR